MRYNEPPTTLEEQIIRIRERGMTISQPEEAAAFLRRVGYYRFSGYALHYEIFENRKRTHQFKAGSRFDDVIRLYRFDSRLRTILFNAIEMIEIAFRAQLCHVMALHSHDSHWLMNPDYFSNQFDHKKFLETCKKETSRSREIFIISYKENYSDPFLPASWMLAEIISFGTWSRVFSGLEDKKVQDDIASIFGLNQYFAESWLHTLTVIRNHCAHHSRIWNRTLTIKPKLTNRLKREYPAKSSGRNHIALIIEMINSMLKPIGKADEFQGNISGLLDDFPDVPKKSMGFKATE